jgi:energy-converting hydrogenase Eha subunit E
VNVPGSRSGVAVNRGMTDGLRITLGAQAVYYLVTGAWPWLSMDTFDAITGPKIDDWLVRMVGLLAAAVGLALLVAAWKRERTAAILVLAVGAGAAFAIVDIAYAGAGRISPVYFGDAAVEVALIALLVVNSRVIGRKRFSPEPKGSADAAE